MIRPENRKALTLKNLMSYTVANSTNFTFVQNLISRTKKITIQDLNKYAFRDLKVLPVALGIFKNFLP